MGNETAIINEILNLLHGTSIGDVTNKILLGVGGLASATIIYFALVVYFQYKVNKRLKEQRSDIDTLILLINEQNKKLDKFHKVLIHEDIKNIDEYKDKENN
jgi:hypothetical protein